MRTALTVLAALSLFGCGGDFEEALEGERKPVTPPGIASLDDVEAVGNAADGNAPAANGAAQPQGKRGIFSKTTNVIVDAKEWREKPGIIVVDNKIDASDPLTGSLQAYSSIASRASLLNFKHQVDIMKNLDPAGPKNLSYKQLTDLMKQMKVELAMLEPWKMYAYDETTGGFLVLADMNVKKRRYEAAGIEWDEEVDGR
ncbi:MAG: hypothetical protein CMJ48_12675 [Planctomycetaceae bacterium]|nr:hypothetical protein [Planctomycetaceae bacterium]